MSAGSNLATDKLKSFIERVERLNEEKSNLTADIASVFSEAKGSGFDVKVMRKLIARRKMDKAEREEMDALIEVYEDALGELKDTPLGKSAMTRAGLDA